jgi:hypothetical protein
VTKTLDQVKGQAMRFLQWKPSEEVSIPIENAEDNTMEIDIDPFTCTEKWEKHKKIELKPDNEGFFQKKTLIQIGKKKCKKTTSEVLSNTISCKCKCLINS